jgi:hypothetical protein
LRNIHITGAASLDLPLRVLNLLAQFEVRPAKVLVEDRGGHFAIDLWLPTETEVTRAELLIAKMEAMVLVASVEVADLLPMA